MTRVHEGSPLKRGPATVNAERARWRSLFLLLAFVLAGAALEGRILYLQLVDKDFLAAQADDRHIRTVQISAHRGSLLDRYGEPLAVSTPVDSIYANPQELKDALDRLRRRRGAIREQLGILDAEEADLAKIEAALLAAADLVKASPPRRAE